MQGYGPFCFKKCIDRKKAAGILPRTQGSGTQPGYDSGAYTGSAPTGWSTGEKVMVGAGVTITFMAIVFLVRRASKSKNK